MLYEIEIEGHAYVEADSKEEAIEIFKRECRSYELMELCDIDAIENPCALWADWKNSEPYGSKDGKKVGEIFAEQLEKENAEKERNEYCERHMRSLPGMEATE